MAYAHQCGYCHTNRTRDPNPDYNRDKLILVYRLDRYIAYGIDFNSRSGIGRSYHFADDNIEGAAYTNSSADSPTRGVGGNEFV